VLRVCPLAARSASSSNGPKQRAEFARSAHATATHASARAEVSKISSAHTKKSQAAANWSQPLCAEFSRETLFGRVSLSEAFHFPELFCVSSATKIISCSISLLQTHSQMGPDLSTGAASQPPDCLAMVPPEWWHLFACPRRLETRPPFAWDPCGACAQLCAADPSLWQVWPAAGAPRRLESRHKGPSGRAAPLHLCSPKLGRSSRGCSNSSSSTSNTIRHRDKHKLATSN